MPTESDTPVFPTLAANPVARGLLLGLRRIVVAVLWILGALLAWTCLDLLGLSLTRAFPHVEIIARVSTSIDDIWWAMATWINSITPEWITIDPEHLF